MLLYCYILVLVLLLVKPVQYFYKKIIYSLQYFLFLLLQASRNGRKFVKE